MSQFEVHDTAVVDQPCIIGKGTHIWHFCHVMSGSVIGNHCSLGQNVYLASSAVLGNNVKIQNNVSIYDGVRLEDDVFIGPQVVFTNVMTPRAHVDRKDQYETTLVRRGASIGANATIICGNTIGEYALVGAGSLIARDVPAHALVFGNPATQRGWVCRCGAKLNDKLVCETCQLAYPDLGHGHR